MLGGNNKQTFHAPHPGLEPKPTEPESAVLPITPAGNTTILLAIVSKWVAVAGIEPATFAL